MSRYSGVKLISHSYIGEAEPIEVAFNDDFRRYVMLYAKQGTCYFCIGPYDPNNEIALTEGNSYEPIIMPRNEIWYRGENSILVTMVDSNEYFTDLLVYNTLNVYAPDSVTVFLKREVL